MTRADDQVRARFPPKLGLNPLPFCFLHVSFTFDMCMHISWSIFTCTLQDLVIITNLVIDYKYASLVTKLVTKLVMLQCRGGGGNMARNCGAASRYPFHLKVLLAYTQYQYSTDSDSEHRPRDAARPARHQQRRVRDEAGVESR
jgi:hypothetical protein